MRTMVENTQVLLRIFRVWRHILLLHLTFSPLKAQPSMQCYHLLIHPFCRNQRRPCALLRTGMWNDYAVLNASSWRVWYYFWRKYQARAAIFY